MLPFFKYNLNFCITFKVTCEISPSDSYIFLIFIFFLCVGEDQSKKCVSQFFYVLVTVHLSIFILVINQLDAQNFCFTISLFHASTCFEHHLLIIRRSKLFIQLLVSSHLQVWWYQRLYNTVLTSWWWAHGARNIKSHETNSL